MAHWRNFVAAAALALAILPLPVFARAHWRYANQPFEPAVILIDDSISSPGPQENIPKRSAEKSGSIPAKPGGSLRLTVQLGSIRVFTDASDEISYRAVIDADPRDPGADEFLRQFAVTARKTASGAAIDARVPWQGLRGRFTASIEVHIPRRYNLDVNSGGGNIEVQDIDGRITLVSAGGNITVGRVGIPETSTAAGSTAAGSVAAEKTDKAKPALLVRIDTQGGRISVGDVQGTLHATTAGGHIIAGNISGDAILRTGGGQIYAKRIAGTATLDTGGGNIHIDSAGSSIAADAAGGSLELRQADAPLRVTAGDGGLTAWLSAASDSKLAGGTKASRKAPAASQLTVAHGNIVLYVPGKLAASIDATIDASGGHRIFADPSLPVQINYPDPADGARSTRYVAQLNGGGEVIQVNAASGNIVLRASDSDISSSAAFPKARLQNGLAPSALKSADSGGDENFPDVDGFFAEMRRRILESWLGAIPVDAEEMQKHLEQSVAPIYPEVARRAGVEGDVVLRVWVSSEGQVTDIKVLDGPPILARAAIQAVQQWQYQAPRMDGRLASVVTTLVLSFRLH